MYSDEFFISFPLNSRIAINESESTNNSVPKGSIIASPIDSKYVNQIDEANINDSSIVYSVTGKMYFCGMCRTFKYRKKV